MDDGIKCVYSQKSTFMPIFRNSIIDKRLGNSPHFAVFLGSGGDLTHIV
jgi:hypothetical protein